MSEPGGSGPETAPAVRAALAERLRRAREKQQGGAAAGTGRIPRRPAGEPAPLSRAQERLWFQERLGQQEGFGRQEGQASGSPLFNICRAADLRGALDAVALNAALAGVTARHGALASRFFDTADGPRQQETAARPRLAVLDLTALPGPRRAVEARRLAGAEARRPFRLDAPPLLRATLLRLTSSPGGAEHSRLLLTVHHLVFDGWSSGLLLRDLSALYRRHLSGASPPAPPPLRFADFAAWERRPGGEAKAQEEGQLDYWRRRLAGAAQAELPELPLDRPRPALPSLAGGTRSFAVPAAVVVAADRLAAAAAQRGAARSTRFTVLLAAWAALLARWSGGQDLLVGTPLANRGPEVEGLVGFFVNTVSLRLDLAGDPSGDELVRRVGESVLEALAHGTVPFARVVQEVTAQRESGAPRGGHLGGHLIHAPLHAVSFALSNAPRGDLDLPGVTVAGIAIVPRGVTDQDLTLALEESDDGGLEATLLYAREVLDATTAARLGAAWVRLLAALTADPAVRLSELPLLSPAQRQQVLVEWAGAPLRQGPAAAPRWDGEEWWQRGGVAAQVAAQAARRPSAPALVAGGTEISYGELLCRADRLAACLSERLATQREALVALCLPRSPELVEAALAVLRAGAAYLPVDVGQPAERVAYLLDDSAASLVLARGELAAELAAAGRPVLDLDVLDLETATDGEAGPPSLAPPPHPDALAYVIYTSGSTGRPKGTLLAHRGLANLVRWHRATFGLGPGERATLVAGTGFDASVWETWSALTAGAALHLPAADVVAAPSRLSAWLVAQRIGHCFLPTPLAEAVLAEPEAAALGASLRVLHVGGDRLHRFADGLPFRLVNQYGPTESTVIATSAEVAAAPPAAIPGAAPPIGRPLPGVPAYVLDRHLSPLPPGAAGELCIGGVGLARGYLGRPGLTAERFVPHPFGRGARLYRSGDLVRWRGDGQLDFLGRIDQQVKVRGFRIELGEIEAVLAGLPAVREAAVLAPAAGGGERRLVAYVVPAEAAAATSLAETAVGETAVSETAVGETVVTETLAAELRRRLPDYMVPAGWVVLDALPLTANGKVDRRALEALEPAHLDAPGVAADEAPRTPLEELVAGQFVSLLHAEAGDEPGAAPASLGRHADFFRLGGHSLLAARLVTRLRDAVGVEVPLRRVFEAPTVAAVAALVEEMRAGDAVGDDGSAPALQPVPRDGSQDGDLPASFAQRRLWFLDQLEPGAPTYNMPAAVDLEGRLDGAALAAACADLAARHEALRTTLPAVDGEPVQRMAPPALAPLFAPLAVIDLTALPAAARAAEARRLGRDEGRRPFDLASGPLLRLRLLALGAADADDDDSFPGHRLLLTVHHAVSDGWSTGVLLRDLAALYDARAAGRAAALPALPVQYADYAAWERRQLSSEVMERHLAWWRGHLAGVPVLELPTDRPRSAVQRTVGRRLRVALPPDLAAAVRAEARRHGATPFMVLLAAFSALLSRHAGQQDFAVGTPVAGRPRRELDGVVGFFVDTLALRTDLAAARLFGDLVAQVRTSLLAAYAHQELPFDRLVEELAPGRNLAHTPLFQVMFILQNAFEAGDAEQSGGGVRFRLAPVEATTSKFEATLSLEETADGGFDGWWVYRSDLFDAVTARRMAERYAVLLRAALEQPRQPLSRLPLLTAGERQQTLVDWNASRVEYDDPPGAAGLLPALFAAAVARDPRAPALVWQTADGDLASLDYGALAARAERLARRLRALGVGPEVRVGICAERSPQTVVAVLGVLLSGGAYVPLDPALPADRLSFMLRDSRLAQVLVTAETADVLPAGAARLLRLDELAAADGGEGGAGAAARSAPLPAPPPEATAYVIYTSGSTGTPKGVAVHHAALGNRLRFARAADLTPDDAFLHKTTLAFDVSVAELLAPLVSGARVVVVRPGGQADPAYLADLMARAGVTQSSFPPTLLEALLEHPGFAALSALRTVVTGGETVPAELPRHFYAEHPEADLLNRYGPTEATISVTSWTCPRGVEERVLPIGRPTAKARVYLLDRYGEPAPVGVPGEIHLGGACVARGYLARPAKTAEVFVPDPFAAAAEPVESGARLYKTGDLARWRPDGALEFVGRVDRQVKVRGYRIELGEIEAALRRHPAVEAAAVVDLPDGASRRLAAYLVAVEKMELDLDEVRAFLADSLPEYMLPTAWTVLGELPLSATGKVDRKALPEPSRGGEAAAYVGPRDDVEARLAEIFAAVLGVDNVGVHDGFFDLGGHSLLATRLVSRMRQRFAADLPLRAVFEQPTVAGLAALLRDGETAVRSTVSASPASAGVASGDGVPLSFAQQRLWFLDRLKPGRAVYNLPAALRLRGPLHAAALQAAVRAIVERHQVLRTVFASDPAAGEAAAEEPVQRLQPLPPADAPLVSRVDFSALPAGRRRAAAQRELARWSMRPFDLARGPLGRYVLLRVEDGEHLFAFAHHHAVFDGWSVALFRRELAELYDACLAPRPPRLPELPIQYADYAVEQRQRAAAGGWDDAVAFWRRELAELAVLELPLDRPRPARRGGGGAERRRALPPGAVETLARVARDADGSLFMAALAVVQVLLARLSGQRDFAVGTPVAGRDQAATENLMGFFVNTLALRSDLGNDAAGDDAAVDGDGPSFVDLLARVRRRTLAAYAHWELPFERLVEELAPERDLSRTPLFQVLLLLRDEAAPAQRLAGGLDAEAVSLSGAGAKLDLTLALAPRAEGVDGGGDAKSLDAGWTLAAEYDPALFDATTVDRLLDRFGRLLAAAGEAPRTPVLALPWLAAAERQQLLVEWNDAPPLDVGHGPAGAAGTLHGAVLAGLAWRPDEVVVIGPRGEELTAGELDRRSAALAARLRRLGVGPEVPVGVALRREPVLVVALLAVLRAGGAYLPLDPTYPAERLAFMLADAAAPVVVADAASRDVLPPGPWHLLAPEEPEEPEELEALEGAAAQPADAAAPALPATASPSNLAYFIYTSGSTGRPKGVAIPHAAAAALLAWARRTFSAAELSYVLVATSVCFDLSVFEIFTPLAAGGRLVLAADALAVADHPAAARVSLLNTVPSAASALLDLGALPPSLRAVHLAGEPLRGELVQRLLAAGGDALRVRNLYGPSEDTTYSTAGEAGNEVAREGREPTLGRPLPGSAGHVVDRRLRLCPVGVAGELVLSGAGLARGYLGRPARTAASWVPDPFAEQPVRGPYSAGRLYRTGDLVRRLADGRLEFLGRIDQQVKVRGFRIELEEVEVALARHPAVREAAVLAAGDRLVAFVLAADPAAAGDATLPRQIIAAAARLLPDYMLPSRLDVLAELPRTASGKVDRRALSGRGGAAPRAQTAGSAPRTRSERLVAELWRELLEVEEPTLEADFFHLGGHSLLATRLISRLARRTGVELPLGTLFEARTVGELATRLEAAQAAGGAPGLADDVPADPVPLPPPPAGVEPPLSYAQQRIWFLDRLAPGSGLYNVALTLRLGGQPHDAALDVAALRAALSELLRRHAALRTRFPVRDGEPVQRVEPALPVRLSVVDLSALAPARRPAVALALARGAARRPFDLEAGPLARFQLLRLQAGGDDGAGGEHLLSLVVHHAVSDGWSFDLLRRELAALYGAFAAGRPSPLAEPELSYVDFSLWQRRWLSGDELERQLAFWRRELAGVAPLELPVDRPRPVRPGVAGGYLTRSVPRSLARRLAELSRRRGSTLFMTALALFQALLARVCAQGDVALGTPVAGRDRLRLEGLVGCLVNTLVLRGDLADDPSFEVLLQRTRESSLAAFAHQDLPFERLVEDLAPRRELARHPLFQVMFTLRRHGTAPPPLPGLATEALSLGTDSAKFELGLGISETEDGGLEAGWDFRRDLFDATSVARLARAWEALAAAALEQPEAPLSTLPLLAAAERHQVSVEWSGEDLGGAADAAPLFHERLAAWTQERPSAVALVAPAAEGTAVDEVTYGELLHRARRLAAGLRRHGVAAEEPVAVLADRSPETVVALLAVLLAGAVYLPLEPTAPAPRLSGLLRDAGVRTVLAHAAVAERLPAELRPLCFHHAAADEAGDAAAATSWPAPHPEQAAYVVFTSGSTGTPKGVVVSHRALARRLATADADLGPWDVSLLTASLAFDVSLMQLAAPLAAGARVVLLPAGGNAAPAELVAALSRHRVTFADFPPLLLNLLLDEAGFAGAALPATLLVGNETVPPALAGRWAERVVGVEPRRRLHNRYGPTETTISVTSWPCSAADAEAPSLPIGRPVAGARTWVTDGALRLVGIGCLGELVVGGELVGRGYLGEPARTAAAFVPDPFSAVPGARLYRTGDHVRLRGDGALELHGRLDRQLKLRGFRVEPGEVEAALVAHPAVREAVVVASGAGESRWLAAYVGVGEAELHQHPNLGDELREDLRSRLPEYMVPATVSVLTALPRGASGKVDAAALPAATLPESEGKAPRDDLERRLLALFEEVLERVPLGVADDFFAHGGHSLLAVRLVVRMEQELGRRLSPAELFLAPSVESLAAVLRRQGAEAAKERPDAHDPLVLLTPPEGDLPLFLVHPVGGDVFCYRELVTALAPVAAGGGVGPVYALRARGLEAGEPPYTSLGDMAERYSAAVRAARPAGPVHLGGWSLGGVVAFEMARRLSADGVEVAAVVLVDSHLPSPPAADSAPGAAPARSAETRQRRLRAFARHLGLPAGSLRDDAAGDGGGAVTLGRVLAAARTAGLLAPEVGIDVLRRLFTVFEAHAEAFAAYRPQPWDGRVVLLAAADAPAAVRLDVDRWRRWAAAVDVHPVPGDHFTILQGDSARRVAEHLERILWRPAPAGRPR